VAYGRAPLSRLATPAEVRGGKLPRAAPGSVAAPRERGRAGRSPGSGCGSPRGSAAATRGSSPHGAVVGRPAPRRSTDDGRAEDGGGTGRDRRGNAYAGAGLRASGHLQVGARVPDEHALFRMDPGGGVGSVQTGLSRRRRPGRALTGDDDCRTGETWLRRRCCGQETAGSPIYYWGSTPLHPH